MTHAANVQVAEPTDPPAGASGTPLPPETVQDPRDAPGVGVNSVGITVTTGDKVLVLGDFKVGKTTLVRVLLRPFEKTWAFDPTWAMPGGRHSVEEALADYNATGHGIYQPYPADWEDGFEKWCSVAMTLDNTMTFIDEPSLVLRPTGTIPISFSALWRLGHKRGNGCILATHRWHGDLPALTRIFDHLFAFRMTVDNDVDELADLIGDEAAEYVRRQPNRAFFHKASGETGGQAYTGIPEETVKAMNGLVKTGEPPSKHN